MKLVVGLGNLGNEYKNTRHNVGFMYVDYLNGDRFSVNKKFNAMEYETIINGEKVMFIKPMTYMNLSGDAVIKYVNYYKIDIDDILVVQDDLDMEVGRWKLLFNHGDGGHNGIKSIFASLGSREFLRLKIGISNSMEMDTKDYVLGKFGKSELDKVNNTFMYLKDFIRDFISMNRNLLMGKYNSKSNFERQ